MSSDLLRTARRKARIWFYQPQMHWFGPWTLSPFDYGHDDLSRRTLVIGWTITGRIVIPLWDCGDQECRDYSTSEIQAWRAGDGHE